MIGMTTERLRFRAWELSDFDAIADFFKNETNARYVGGLKSAEESWRLMATYLGHYQLLGYSYLAVETTNSQELIGTIGLWNSEPWPEPELGYWLLPAYQGKGYAMEACQAALAFAKKRQLPSLVSYIDQANEPSKRLAIKLGAKLSGETNLLDFGVHQVYRYW